MGLGKNPGPTRMPATQLGVDVQTANSRAHTTDTTASGSLSLNHRERLFRRKEALLNITILALMVSAAIGGCLLGGTAFHKNANLTHTGVILAGVPLLIFVIACVDRAFRLPDWLSFRARFEDRGRALFRACGGVHNVYLVARWFSWASTALLTGLSLFALSGNRAVPVDGNSVGLFVAMALGSACLTLSLNAESSLYHAGKSRGLQENADFGAIYVDGTETLRGTLSAWILLTLLSIILETHDPGSPASFLVQFIVSVISVSALSDYVRKGRNEHRLAMNRTEVLSERLASESQDNQKGGQKVLSVSWLWTAVTSAVRRPSASVRSN